MVDCRAAQSVSWGWVEKAQASEQAAVWLRGRSHLIVRGAMNFQIVPSTTVPTPYMPPNLDKPWLSHIRPHHGIWITLRWQIRLILWAEVELGIFGRPSRPKTTSEKQGPCLGSCSRTSDELVSVGWGGHAQYVEGTMVMGLVISHARYQYVPTSRKEFIESDTTVQHGYGNGSSSLAQDSGLV